MKIFLDTADTYAIKDYFDTGLIDGVTTNPTLIMKSGRDPEDAFTNIPYEKGAHFLWLIEKTVGRKAFDKFMTDYFRDNKLIVYCKRTIFKSKS